MSEKFVIISPCFNEETLISTFLQRIEDSLIDTQKHFTVLMIDDGSTDQTIQKLSNFRFRSSQFQLKVIALNFNSGHQNAIRQGLLYAKTIEANGYIVMDSDGEDDPSAIVQLIENQKSDIVFVSRGKRQEGFRFKLGYHLYKVLFKLISGKQISYGNYSMISPRVLDAISHQSFFHYAAFLSKLRFSKTQITSDRQKRIDGQSKMAYNSLVFHGLNALIEYAEELLFFLIKIFVGTFVLLSSIGCYVLYAKFVSDEALLGWPSTLGATLLNSTLIMFGVIVISLLVISVKSSLRQKEITFKEII